MPAALRGVRKAGAVPVLCPARKAAALLGKGVQVCPPSGPATSSSPRHSTGDDGHDHRSGGALLHACHPGPVNGYLAFISTPVPPGPLTPEFSNRPRLWRLPPGWTGRAAGLLRRLVRTPPGGSRLLNSGVRGRRRRPPHPAEPSTGRRPVRRRRPTTPLGRGDGSPSGTTAPQYPANGSRRPPRLAPAGDGGRERESSAAGTGGLDVRVCKVDPIV
jgi:hypothetical protein